MLQIVQEIVGYFKHMDELDNLDRLESENVEIDSLDLIGLGEVFGGGMWRRYLEEVFGIGIWRRYLGKVFEGGTMTFEKMGWTTAIRIEFKITLHFEILDRLEP